MIKLPIKILPPKNSESIIPQQKPETNENESVTTPIITVKREFAKKELSYESVIEKTNVLYNEPLLPEELYKKCPVSAELYEMFERIFPTTGILGLFIATSLSSMCTSESRQFNLLIGKETGEGGTLVVQQFSKIPFVRDIFDYKTAAGFCLDYLGLYLTRLGSATPKGVIPPARKTFGIIDKSGCTPVDNSFFISKGLDRLFHQGAAVLERTFTFWNPLFEEGYAQFSDGYSGSYVIGSKERRLKIGFIGICTLEDFENKALNASGWTERIVMGTWRSHEIEDKLVIQGINRKYLPEVDISDVVLDKLHHLNPNYPIKVKEWGEEIAIELDKFAEYCKIIRGEKKGKRAARDATRIIQAIPVLNKRDYIDYCDLAFMDGLVCTMKRQPSAMGWRIPFLFSIYRWFESDYNKIINKIYNTFCDWNKKPLYSKEFISKSVREFLMSEEEFEIQKTKYVQVKM